MIDRVVDATDAFLREYGDAFREYLDGGAERSLEAAYELGRRAVTERLSLMDLAEAHHAVLREVARPEDVARAAEFFRESLTTFEIAARAFRDAHDTVRLEQAHAELQRSLAEAAVTLNDRLEPPHILQVAADQARRVLPARAAVARMRLEPWPEPVTGVSGDAPGDGDAALRAPLLGRDRRQLGSLAVYGPALSADSDKNEAVLLQLARMTAAAIENAQRYQRERTVAETLQRSLLPAGLPEVPGVTAAAAYWPAGDGIQVGGDFYDVFRLDHGPWALIIGDVCGKGPAAAALTALTRYTSRASGRDADAPGEVLRSVNAAMLEQRTEGRFATMLCAFLTPGPGGARLVLTSGGHPLPLVLRAGGEVETIGTRGTLLGVLAEPTLVESETQLAPGDTLLLFTDGAIEVRRGRRETFGTEDLVRLLEQCRGLAPAEILEAIREAVTSRAGGPLRDDVALLALSVRDTGI